MAIFSETVPARARAWSLLLLALCGVSAPACAPTDSGVGFAVRRNAALHVINPSPEYAAEMPEGASGERAALAQERYRTGAVKQPATIQTTSRPNSSGPSSGGSEGRP